jgi:methionyl-tRNA formyltransferase
MSNPKLRIAFFGTPYVARDTFAKLGLAGYKPTVVITNTDTKQGRGQTLQPCVTKTWAEEESIPVLSPIEINEDAIREIQSYNCDYAIVVAYGKILPQALIDTFPKGILNVHYSLLPKYRGASPVESAIKNGETVTGVTIQKLVLAMDAGDILAQKELLIGEKETAPELKERLIDAGAELLIEVLPLFEMNEIAPTPQDHNKATFAKKIKKEERELFLNGNPQENWNTYRAYAEDPGTHFFAEKNGKTIRVKITGAELKDGVFIPLRVIPEGKNEMEYGVFLKSVT